MENNFDDVLNRFVDLSIDQKIKVFTSYDNLTLEQYVELLKYYPVKSMDRLIKAVLKK